MVMAMDLKGKTFSSSEFSKVIQKNLSDETKVQIVIGGSLGISDSILNKAQKRITFSKMTYPHQLFRIMVLEELSRALV